MSSRLPARNRTIVRRQLLPPVAGGSTSSVLYNGSTTSAPVDNTTIEYDTDGKLRVKDAGVTNDKIAAASKIGLLASLTTTVKTAIVDAINELVTSIAGKVTGSGVAGHVAFWSGAGTVDDAAGLFWDSALGLFSVGAASEEIGIAEITTPAENDKYGLVVTHHGDVDGIHVSSDGTGSALSATASGTAITASGATGVSATGTTGDAVSASNDSSGRAGLFSQTGTGNGLEVVVDNATSTADAFAVSTNHNGAALVVTSSNTTTNAAAVQITSASPVAVAVELYGATRYAPERYALNLNLTLDGTHHYIEVSTTTAGVTLTLPTRAAWNDGIEYIIHDVGGNSATGGRNITLNTDGTDQFIDAAVTTKALASNYARWLVVGSTNTAGVRKWSIFRTAYGA